jgi:hypothetical protein
LASEIITKQRSRSANRWGISTHKGGVLTMSEIHSLSVEWLPVSIAPPDADLEVCVRDFDGIVLSLAYPCHKIGADWVDASNKKHIDIQPTHWRNWTESP